MIPLLFRLRLVTGKNRRTHLVGFTTLMSVRESTIPQIAKTLRQNSSLPKELQGKVESMIKKAKHDVDDFYGEITYRTQRKKENHGRGRSEKTKPSKNGRGASQESTTVSSRLDRLLKKRTLELGECTDGEDSPNDNEMNESDQEEEEESESLKFSSGDEDDKKGPDGKKRDRRPQKVVEKKDNDDDLFEGTRFSPGSQAGSATPTPTPPNSGVQFGRTLQEMISKAVECGALASDPFCAGSLGRGDVDWLQKKSIPRRVKAHHNISI